MNSPIAIDPDAEFSFVSGQGRANWPTLIADFTARSTATAGRAEVSLDVRYGPRPRQVYDFVPATAPAHGSVIYLHPGYWQMRDKAQFRFIADVFGPLGFDTYVPNYPLAPDATVAEITEAVREIVDPIRERSRIRHGRDLPIVASGHSAGAHLAIELALTEATAWGLSSSPVVGVVALSGVYDLCPLVGTSLNAKLALTLETARAASPVHRVARAECPALFVVGGGETAAFRAQNTAMANAWRAGGGDVVLREEPEADHFSLITRLADPETETYSVLRAFLARF